MPRTLHTGCVTYTVLHLLTLALTRLRAFTPRVIEFVIPFVSTVPEPSAATPAATGFAGLETAAFGTSGGQNRSSVCFRGGHLASNPSRDCFCPCVTS